MYLKKKKNSSLNWTAILIILIKNDNIEQISTLNSPSACKSAKSEKNKNKIQLVKFFYLFRTFLFRHHFLRIKNQQFISPIQDVNVFMDATGLKCASNHGDLKCKNTRF